MQSLSATYDASSGAGISNIGRISDSRMDELLKKLAVAENPDSRQKLAQEVLALEKTEVFHIPFLQPMFSWAMKKNVEPIVRPDNRLTLEWVTIR